MVSLSILRQALLPSTLPLALTAPTPGFYDSTRCFSATRGRETSEVNPCVDAGHQDIIDPAICAEAIIEVNTKRGASSPDAYGTISEQSFERLEVVNRWDTYPYGCQTSHMKPQDFPNSDPVGATLYYAARVNLNPDGVHSGILARTDPARSVTFCCIPSEGCPCGAEEDDGEGQKGRVGSKS